MSEKEIIKKVQKIFGYKYDYDVNEILSTAFKLNLIIPNVNESESKSDKLDV